jgi:hypothetical protein
MAMAELVGQPCLSDPIGFVESGSIVTHEHTRKARAAKLEHDERDEARHVAESGGHVSTGLMDPVERRVSALVTTDARLHGPAFHLARVEPRPRVYG